MKLLVLLEDQFDKYLPVPSSKQTTDYTCGPAALRAVLKYYGLEDHNEDKLADDMGTTFLDGTDIPGFKQWAKKNNLNVVTKSMTVDDVKNYIGKGIPVILNIQAWGELEDYSNEYDWGHYVVAIGYNKDKFVIEDPYLSGGRGELSTDELNERWHGEGKKKYHKYGIVLIKNGESPAENVRVNTKKIK